MIALLLALAVTKQTVCFVTTSDERKEVEAVCPVEGTRFKAYEVVTTNPWGGRDYDNCPHALKTTPLEYWVWVCPTCHFAGRKKDFDAKLTDEEKRALSAHLKPALAIPKGTKQTDIPGHVKFDLLAQTAQLRKAPPEQAAVAWLGASWSARQQGAIDFADFDEWDQLKGVYGLNKTPMEIDLKKNRTDYDLDAARKVEKDLEAKKYERGVNRVLARYLVTFLHRKHGENVDALRWLAEVEKVKGENSIVDDAAVKMRASIDLERVYQRKAIDAYVAAIESKTLEKRTPGVAYMIGELFRRLGERDSALSWYQTALEKAEGDDFKKRISDQKAKAEKP